MENYTLELVDFTPRPKVDLQELIHVEWIKFIYKENLVVRGFRLSEGCELSRHLLTCDKENIHWDVYFYDVNSRTILSFGWHS